MCRSGAEATRSSSAAPSPAPFNRGLVEPPFFVRCVFGILGGIGADPDHPMHKQAADKTFRDRFHFPVFGTGRHRFPLVPLSAILGGNVRVGLEDDPCLGRDAALGRTGDVQRGAGRQDVPHPGEPVA